MASFLERSHPSTRAATVVGLAVGIAAVAVYLGAGLLVADWSVADFLAHLSLGTVGYVLGSIALVVAVFAVPLVALLRFGLLAPLAVLVFAIVGWFVLGAVQGLLTLQTSFGIALYAAMLSPLYLLLYVVLGGAEYVLRARTDRWSWASRD